MQLVVAALKSKNYRAACDSIDALISDNLPVGLSAASTLGLRRFAARMAFVAANDYGAAFTILRQRFEARFELGFEGPLDALPVLTEYATRCAQLGETTASRQVLLEARDYLTKLLPQHGEARRCYSRIIEACERELNEGG